MIPIYKQWRCKEGKEDAYDPESAFLTPENSGECREDQQNFQGVCHLSFLAVFEVTNINKKTFSMMMWIWKKCVLKWCQNSHAWAIGTGNGNR